MRPPAAAREIATAALARLPIQAAAQAPLAKAVAEGRHLTPTEMVKAAEVLARPADTPQARLAHALLGGAPMARALAAAAPAEVSTGIMVAWVPDQPARFAQPGGLPVDDLHVTAVFCGDTTDLDDPDTTATVLQAVVAEWAAGEQVVHGAFTHRAHMGADPAEVAQALEVDSDQLRAARRRLVMLLNAYGLPWSNRWAFRPHMTETYVAPDAAAEAGPLPAPLAVTFSQVRLSIGTDEHRYPLQAAEAQGQAPNVTAAAGGQRWPTMNAALATVQDEWERTDDLLRTEVVTAVDMGWRAAMDRVGRSISQASGDPALRAQPTAVVACSGVQASGVNVAQLIAGPVRDTAAAVDRALGRAWQQPLATLDEHLDVGMTTEALNTMAGWSRQATAWLADWMTEALLARIGGTAEGWSGDPTEAPASLVSDVLAAASSAERAEYGVTRDAAGRPVGVDGLAGGDGLATGPAGVWVMREAIQAWSAPQAQQPGWVLADGRAQRRKAGARISSALSAELADAAAAFADPVTAPVQVVEGVWTLEMNGRVVTEHEPQHKQLAGTVIRAEGDLASVSIAADPDVWPYVPHRRPGDHRYCKCGWRTRVVWE